VREDPETYCDVELEERLRRVREARAAAQDDRDFALRDLAEQLVHLRMQLQTLVKGCNLFNDRASAELRDAQSALEHAPVPRP
jgi:hypothetical protein